jgi:ankyrin repeat protein
MFRRNVMIRPRSLVAGTALAFLLIRSVLGQSPGPAAAAEAKAEALADAARKGDAAAVTKLLDEGVDVNTKFRYGTTALSFASDRGHLDVVKVLLDRGADVNVRDTFYNATPLTWAVSPQMGRKPQHPEIVRLLLAKGATGKGPALTAAVSAGDAATTKIVLESGTFPADALSDMLDAATRGKRPEIVALLEAAGAKPRVEFKMDDSQLARYAGTYSGPGGAELVLTVAGGRLAGTAGGQRLTFVARDATTFGVVEGPGATLTIRLEGDKVTSIGFPNNTTTWTRTEGK